MMNKRLERLSGNVETYQWVRLGTTPSGFSLDVVKHGFEDYSAYYVRGTSVHWLADGKSLRRLIAAIVR